MPTAVESPEATTLSPTRQIVAKLFRDYVPENEEITSNGKYSDRFTKLTGWDQSGLDTTWKIEETARAAARKAGKSEREIKMMANTTTCNAFVVQVGNAIKSPVPLGQFYIDNVLKKASFDEAWVPSNSGLRPELGDPFVTRTRGHMGVTEKFVGDQWYTVESGQGGHGIGHDVLKRKNAPWDPGYLLGWVDIDMLMRLAQPAPAWLLGWWQIDLGGTQAWLYVGDRPKCPCFAKKPIAMSGKPVGWTPWYATVHLAEGGQSATLDFGAGGPAGSAGLVKDVKSAGPNAIAGIRDGGAKFTGTRPG